MSLGIRPATAGDYAAVRAMLGDAGLPVEDFIPEHLEFVAEDDGELVAAIGFERFGDTGLLRSLVVDDDRRYRGVGRRLVAQLEEYARQQGVGELWLLTLDAAAYFGNLGYETRRRDAAPPVIRSTAEFASLCPDDAVLMTKRLA